MAPANLASFFAIKGKRALNRRVVQLKKMGHPFQPLQIVSS
jgi:hypothetical protein